MTAELVIQSFVLAVVGGLAIFARTSVQEAAKSGVEEWVKNQTWPAELGRELERLRGTERQQLRFVAYGGLWSKTQPIAAFSGDRFDAEQCLALRDSLAGWYYSSTGGLLLTTEARSAYVALQRLLDGLVRLEGWEAVRPPNNLENTFDQVCERAGVEDVRGALDSVSAGDWPADIGATLETWETSMDGFVNGWEGSTPEERYAVLHQVASRLRTVLTKDVDSRLR